MPRLITLFAMGLALILGRGASSQTLSGIAEFQHLSAGELLTLQVKVAEVGFGTRPMRSLVLAAADSTPHIERFRPFYRQAFPYAGDYRVPILVPITGLERESIVERVAAIAGVADGGVDADPRFSLALSVIKNEEVKVFESVLDTTNARLLFQEMIAATFPGATADGIYEYVCSFGYYPGGVVPDVSSSVDIRVRGFRKDRSSGDYVGTVRITNTSGAPITAPIYFVCRPPMGVDLIAEDGFTCGVWPRGAPYRKVLAQGVLAPGAHVETVLRFRNPDDTEIQLPAQRVVAGAGFR